MNFYYSTIKKITNSSDISVSDLDEKKLSIIAEKGVNTYTSNLEASEGADVIILAVKPNIL